MLSKALHPQDVRAFVLPVGLAPLYHTVQILVKWKFLSDPKPQQMHTVYTPTE